MLHGNQNTMGILFAMISNVIFYNIMFINEVAKYNFTTTAKRKKNIV